MNNHDDLLIDQLVPFSSKVDLINLLDQLSKIECDKPFNDNIINFFSDFSKLIFSDKQAKRYPELQALAFKLRKSAVLNLKREFVDLSSTNVSHVPRGLVFHIPPSNVDSIFIYSWLYSVLIGNRNIIRITPNEVPQIQILTKLMRKLFNKKDYSSIGLKNSFISYGHEEYITREISKHSDLRIIWGGDETVDLIRAIPLKPSAKEIVFPDRFSYSIISAKEYLKGGNDTRNNLAADFYNDAYWFDQSTCSSPRLIIWLGIESDFEDAFPLFYKSLEEIIKKKKYQISGGTLMSKLSFTYEATINEDVLKYDEFGKKIMVLTLRHLKLKSREHCGGGLFYQTNISDIKSITEFVQAKDQTLTYFGLKMSEIEQIILLTNGKGIDRIVPIGQALNFGRYWDGMDLLQELTKKVYFSS